MQVSLVMFKVDGSRWDFPVNKPRIVIGRTSHCDLRIPLSSVSRQHCEVRLENDQVKLRDLGSSNGTHHNHIRVQEATLKPGDEIVVGPVVFTVVIDGEPVVVEPRRTMVGTPPQKKSAPPTPETKRQPQPLEVNSSDDEFPTLIEADTHTPTVNLDDDDDDALASLQALAAASESDDSGELPMLSDDDDELPPAKQKP